MQCSRVVKNKSYKSMGNERVKAKKKEPKIQKPAVRRFHRPAFLIFSPC